jgi:hypothetical protein
LMFFPPYLGVSEPDATFGAQEVVFMPVFVPSLKVSFYFTLENNYTMCKLLK